MSRRASGLVVMVTGASSGIGRATALLAAEQGHHLVLVARNAEVLDEVAGDCLRRGAVSAVGIPTDVSDDDAVSDLVAKTLSEHGRIDAVLHSAGIVTYGRLEDTSAEDFASVVGTNLLGTASVARHVVPVMRRQGRGDLVLVGSLLGHIAVPDMSAYVVSKWGVRALARQLKIENQDVPGLHVAHVSPGSVDTEIYDNAIDDAGMVNTPPPPTISPERVARVVVRQIGSRRHQVQTAWLNYGVLGAFDLAPTLWDKAIGPIFDAASRRKRDR